MAAPRADRTRRPAEGAKAPMRSIVWLASYPKSGNTWLRIFLANYIFNLDRPVPINQVHRIGMGDSVATAYRKVAKNPEALDITNAEHTLKLRNAVLRGVVNNGAEINFLKTHNQRMRVREVELIPRQFTRAAIYVLRDPRDMLVSYARHYGHDVATAAEAISARINYVIPDETTTTQWLGSWSDHVTGWTTGKGFPVLTLRYEDMKADPVAAFGKAVKFIGLPVDPARLEKAIRFSDFDELKRQEAEGGFIEKPTTTDRFFHTGTSGQWKDLDPAVIARIEEMHGGVMRRHGYL